jgi:hypothetical protein
MRHGLAKLLRQGHRLAEKRRYRRRGNNEQPNFQNVRLSSSSAAFLLIVVLAAGRAAHGQNIAILGVSRFEVRISNYWRLDCLSGKAPDFSGKDPLGSLFVCPTQGMSPSRRFQFPKTQSTFHPHAQRNAFGRRDVHRLSAVNCERHSGSSLSPPAASQTEPKETALRHWRKSRLD